MENLRKHLTACGARWYGQKTIGTACGKRANVSDVRPEGPISCPDCQHAAADNLQAAKQHCAGENGIDKSMAEIYDRLGLCGFY